MPSRPLPSQKLLHAALPAILSLLSTAAGAADALAIDKDAVRIQSTLEVGTNGPDISAKGASIQGFSGRNYFQDSEKAGALRVGAVWGKPGIYAEKGDIVVGSQSGNISLKGNVDAVSYAGKGAVPVGAILMWSGPSDKLPAGWALCNGKKYDDVQTPDLSSRFIVGYDEKNGSPYNVVGNTGGEATHVLKVNEVPGHVHRLGEAINFTGEHNHYWGGSGTTGATGIATLYAGRSEHQQNTGPVIPSEDAQPHENRPPYYVLAFIMYTGK